MVVAESAQLSLNDKSRVSREAQARFREGLGVQLPGATRPAKRNTYPFELLFRLAGATVDGVQVDADQEIGGVWTSLVVRQVPNSGVT